MELTAVAPTEEPTTAQLTAVAVATELTAAVPTEELTMAELKADGADGGGAGGGGRWQWRWSGGGGAEIGAADGGTDWPVARR